MEVKSVISKGQDTMEVIGEHMGVRRTYHLQKRGAGWVYAAAISYTKGKMQPNVIEVASAKVS